MAVKYIYLLTLCTLNDFNAHSALHFRGLKSCLFSFYFPPQKFREIIIRLEIELVFG